MSSHGEKKLTNPAERLYDILGGAGQSQQVFRHYLAGRFGGDAKNDLQMLRKVLGLYDLVSLVERRISAMKHVKRNTFASCIPPIVAAVQQTSLDHQATQLTQVTSQTGALHILDLAADALQHEDPEYLLEQSQLDTLITAAAELRHKVTTADLPDPVVKIIVDSLEKIDAALRNYALGGLEGIDRAVKEACGAAIVEHATMIPAKESPVVRAYWDWLSRVNATVAACKTAYGAGTALKDAMPHLLDYFK